MKPEIGKTYERERERRTVTKVSKAGVVSYTLSLWSYDYEKSIPNAPAYCWQPDGEDAHKAAKQPWGKWAAWATEVPLDSV